MTEDISRSIHVLRFPLAVMVVFIHSFGMGKIDCSNAELCSSLTSYDVYNYIRIYISNIVCQVAVPLFFFISGYLFYQKLSVWNWDIWKNKMRSRFWTLLVPYLIWNIIRLLFNNFLLNENITFNGSHIWWHYLWVDSGYINWKGTLISLSAPLHIPFWFIRNLIVIIFFTPLIYIIIKSRLNKIYMLLLLVAYISSIFPTMPGVCSRSLFFFSLGAWCSISHIDYLSKIGKYVPIFIVMSFFTSFILLMKHESAFIGSIVLPLFVLCFMAVCLVLSAKRYKFLSLCRLNIFETNTFFIFAFHSFVLVLLYRFIEFNSLLNEI